MRTRRIAGQSVTAVGGGELSLPVSDARGLAYRDVQQALAEAIGFGITVFDIAADADSEKLAGETLRSERARDRVVLATRVPLLDERPGPPRDLLRELLPTRYLQDRVEATLRQTRLDALPLVQLALRPTWLTSTAWPELVGSCARLVREGKVLAWGLWLDEPGEDAAALIGEPWLAALSVVYHLCDRRAEAAFAAADLRELPILARQPLAGGALAGALGPGMRLSPRDDRGNLDAATLERIAVTVARLSVLVKHAPAAAQSCAAARAAAERAVRPAHLECSDVAELATRFVIDRAGRAGIALPRLHRHEHTAMAVAAAAAPPLSADLVARIVEELG